MSACSNIVMKSETVASIAESCIQRIEAYRERLAHDYCEIERKAWSTRFWAWVTRSSLPTDEEIRGGWENDPSVFSPAFDLRMTCWRAEEAATRLLLASKHATEVSVSVYDLELVTP